MTPWLAPIDNYSKEQDGIDTQPSGLKENHMVFQLYSFLSCKTALLDEDFCFC